MALKYKTPQKTHIKKLEKLQRNVCVQFQCIPERTSYIAVYALTGAEPIEVTLDKYCINLFFGIARLDSTIEKQMLLWESANANALFINKIAGILEKKFATKKINILTLVDRKKNSERNKNHTPSPLAS